MSDDARYPIGKFSPLPALDDAGRLERIDAIAALPNDLMLAVDGLTDAQLDTPYRDGGWTVRQVVHHVADSHTNAYIRMRLAVTEDEPTIKPYDEVLWAKLADSESAPVSLSLDVIDALHKRWTWWMRTLEPALFSRRFRHPEHGPRDMDWLLQLYAWHGQHHLAHITGLSARNNW